MIVSFDDRTADRLAEIERDEGVSPENLVRQAVTVWCELNAAERKKVGILAMQIVVARLRTSS